MSLGFAVGLALGAAVVVFGRDSRPARWLLLQVHVRAAILRRWISRRR